MQQNDARIVARPGLRAQERGPVDAEHRGRGMGRVVRHPARQALFNYAEVKARSLSPRHRVSHKGRSQSAQSSGRAAGEPKWPSPWLIAIHMISGAMESDVKSF